MNVHETQLDNFKKDVEEYTRINTMLDKFITRQPMYFVVTMVSVMVIWTATMVIMSNGSYRETFTHTSLAIAIVVFLFSGYKFLAKENERGKIITQKQLLKRKLESRAVISAQKIQEHLQGTNPELVTRYQILKEYYKIKEVEELE